MDCSIVVLAAGHGKRMRSNIPKISQLLAGKPLIDHIITNALAASPRNIHLVYSEETEVSLRKILEPYTSIHWIEQKYIQGTGSAAQCVLPYLNLDYPIIFLYGDVPIIHLETLQAMHKVCANETLVLLTTYLSHPHGYGRIIRDETGQICAICEEKDSSLETKCIKEVNTGIIAIPPSILKNCLPLLTPSKKTGEYYLTEIIEISRKKQYLMTSITTGTPYEAIGVNNFKELAELEKLYQYDQAYRLMQQGVHIINPHQFINRGKIIINGHDIRIDTNCIFEGLVSLNSHVRIDANCIIRDCHIGMGSHIHAFTCMEGAALDENCQIGPYARIRPTCSFSQKTKIGNFVEVKNSTFGQSSKASHLSYIGDTTIGHSVNIGAMTVTCNYDGHHKHHTYIADHAFIGSGTQLIAPIIIEKYAIIGAGSTITKNAPAQQVTLSRSPQKSYLRSKYYNHESDKHLDF